MKLLEVYKEKVLGTIKGLDRMRFRGTLRWLATERGINTYTCRAGILLKDFWQWAEQKTKRLRSCCEQQAQLLGIPLLYLNRSGVDKDGLARQIAKDKGVAADGSICMLSVVELCMAPAVSGNKKTKRLELTYRPRKCIHIYHYFDHPQVGFGHVRLQTWIPFGVTLCLNGRHWLEKRLISEGIGFAKEGNCFPWIEDMEAAQKLLDEQLNSNWPALLNSLICNTCPELPQLLSPWEFKYYWSAEETEWATDIMFCSDFPLNELYPRLLRHAMIVSDSPAVMRYLGRGELEFNENRPRKLPESILSDCRRRHEGMRVKHWRNNNSIKVYNKTATILRIETTINDTREFKVFRHPDDNPVLNASWQKLRKGVSDLHRRCQISNQANERYAAALGATVIEEKLRDVLGPACRRIKQQGKSYRALNPWSPQDFQLLSFFGKGTLAINGFRNKDLRKFIYDQDGQVNQSELRRRSGRVSRLIKLLRAHGLVRKVCGENRYMPTDKGRKISTALLCASEADLKRVLQLAA
jgi:hypothetical protein